MAFKGLDAIALMIIWPAIELSKKKSLTQAPNNWLSTYIGEFEKLQNASAALKQETRKPQKHIIPIATHYCELANTWLNVLKKLIEQRSAYITTTEMTWVADNEFASLKVIEILGEALSHISIYRSEISNLETSPLLNTLENLIRGVDDCHAPEHEDMIVELKQQLEELRPCLSATPSIEFTDIRKAPTDIFNNPLSPEDEVSIEMEEVSLLGNRKA